MKKKKLQGRVKKVFFILVITSFISLFATVQVSGQQGALDYNSYYRYPLSVGVEYQSLTPFADYGSNYNIFEIAAHLRWPFLNTPVFIPEARVGLMTFDSQDPDPAEAKKWSHRHYFVL